MSWAHRRLRRARAHRRRVDLRVEIAALSTRGWRACGGAAVRRRRGAGDARPRALHVRTGLRGSAGRGRAGRVRQLPDGGAASSCGASVCRLAAAGRACAPWRSSGGRSAIRPRSVSRSRRAWPCVGQRRACVAVTSHPTVQRTARCATRARCRRGHPSAKRELDERLPASDLGSGPGCQYATILGTEPELHVGRRTPSSTTPRKPDRGRRQGRPGPRSTSSRSKRIVSWGGSKWLTSYAGPSTARMRPGSFEDGMGKIEIVNADAGPVGRATFEPGWQWSKHVKPIAGTESCQAGHTGYFVSGRMKVVMDGGEEMEYGPGDFAQMAPGHDAWVVGDEPCVVSTGRDSATTPSADGPDAQTRAGRGRGPLESPTAPPCRAQRSRSTGHAAGAETGAHRVTARVDRADASREPRWQ